MWIRIVRGGAGLGGRARGVVTRVREAELLRERARFARTSIVVNNVVVSCNRLPLARPVVDAGGETIGEATVIDVPGETPDKPTIVLVCGGIEVERLHPPHARPGFFAVVEAPLGRDLTRSEFIRGPEYDALVARVLEHQAEAAKALAIPAMPGTSTPTTMSRRGRAGLVSSLLLEGIGLLMMVLAVSAASEGLFLGGFVALIAGVLGAVGVVSSDSPQAIAPAKERAEISAGRKPRLGQVESRRALPPAPEPTQSDE